MVSLECLYDFFLLRASESNLGADHMGFLLTHEPQFQLVVSFKISYCSIKMEVYADYEKQIQKPIFKVALK